MELEQKLKEWNEQLKLKKLKSILCHISSLLSPVLCVRLCVFFSHLCACFLVLGLLKMKLSGRQDQFFMVGPRKTPPSALDQEVI